MLPRYFTDSLFLYPKLKPLASLYGCMSSPAGFLLGLKSKGNFLITLDSFEPRCEKNGFLHIYMKTKTQISYAQLISTFVLAIRIEQSLYYFNPKFQASSYLLRLHSLVCVRPGRKPRRPFFTQRGSFFL